MYGYKDHGWERVRDRYYDGRDRDRDHYYNSGCESGRNGGRDFGREGTCRKSGREGGREDARGRYGESSGGNYERGYPPWDYPRRNVPVCFNWNEPRHHKNQCPRLVGEGGSNAYTGPRGRSLSPGRGTHGNTRRSAPEEPDLCKQLEDLKNSLSPVREFVDKQKETKEEKERRKFEKEERVRREAEEKEEAERRTMRKEAKQRREEEKRALMRKDMAMELSIRMGGIESRIDRVDRKVKKVVKETVGKGKAKMATSDYTSTSDDESGACGGWGDNDIEEISSRTGALKITERQEKRKRSAEKTVGDSPPMITSAKRTPRRAGKPVKLAEQLRHSGGKTTPKMTAKKTSGRTTPRTGSQRKKVPAKIGSEGKVKYIRENMLLLADMTVDELKQIFLDKDIKLAEVRKVVNDKIEGLDLPVCVKKEARNTVRTVWVKNPTVASMLHNQRRFAKAEVQTCCCAGLPYPRIGEHVQFRLQELEGIHPMICNANNISKPDYQDRSQMLCEEIGTAFEGWVNSGDQKTVVEVCEVNKCLTGLRTERAKYLTTREVEQVKAALKGLVVKPLDRNTGESMVICHKVYFEAMMDMFVRSEGYVVETRTEEVVRTQMKAEIKLHNLQLSVKWDGQGDFGDAYVLPKHKDLCRFRPICPTYSEPTIKAGRNMSRALNHMLFTLLRDWHFNLRYVSTVASRIDVFNRRLERWMKRGCELVSRSYDIKDMFSRLPHEEIVKSVEWLVDYHSSKARKFVRVNPRGKGSNYGHTTGDDHWKKIDLTQIVELVRFELKHTYTRATEVLLRQVVGIPMGKGTSPPLVCIMCAYAEYKFLRSMGDLCRDIFGLRLMDDVSLIVLSRSDNDEDVERINVSFEKCYPKNLTLKRTDDGGNSSKFLGMEMRTSKRPSYIGKVQLSKNEEGIWGDEELEFKNGQDYNSWGSKQQKSAAIASYLHRIDRNTTLREEIPMQVLTLKRELCIKKCPKNFFERVLRRFTKGKDRMWESIYGWLFD
ncbi:hypothetical protein CBR_g41131 [Chara braunii]|uniref:Reverse transcriptase domain-containing protein n=1 Tax=Chara braunii TaxID=69332 RepID=A0A388LV71_CHABU|nr:hypothetical protein CBR_g41131 [Chara braunii]|eukprot:GBG86226.1 hypothetical protein CBR_g41131 [Chara braunii]